MSAWTRCPGRLTVAALVAALGLVFIPTAAVLAQHGSSPAQSPDPEAPIPEKSPEEIQRQRMEAERQQAEYLAEKARVEHINERVRQYKELMARIPFELAPNTVDMVMVYMDNQDLRKIAQDIFNVSDNSETEKFEDHYWPMVLYLNRASDYYDGMPHYGKLDPESPENNVALFPNVRKQGYRAVVSRITSEDSVISQQMTGPPVVAFRKRLQEQVRKLSAEGGAVPEPAAPERMPGENRVALFQGLQSEPQETYPSRSTEESSKYVSTAPVAVDRPINLDPSPPAWALRQEINMLGPDYQGYNVQYTPDRFDLAPEFAPIAFMGGRDAAGNPRTQPGFHFGLNQRFFNFLVTNECAFVAFSAADAPSMNGGALNAGLDMNLNIVNLSALVGAAGVNVIGGFEFGPAYTGKVRVPITKSMQLFGLYTYTTITKYRVEDATGGHTGVSNASYAGLGVVLR